MKSLTYISISPVSSGAFQFVVNHPLVVLVFGVAGMIAAIIQWRERNKIIAK